jgi:3-oxoacyl-[acyl-carrier protein] reductase
MDLGIAGRRAIVCGGSKGLGRCADALAADGVHLVLVARSTEALESTAREIAARSGAKVDAVAADVATAAGRAAIPSFITGQSLLLDGGQFPGLL